MEQDRIYANAAKTIADFQFDDQVANVFPDMIKRSVPGYSTLVSSIGVIAAHYAQPDSRLYDLGCSLGAVSLAMQHRVQTPGCSIVAVDNSESMLTRARDYIENEEYPTAIQLTLGDIEQAELANASVVVLNFTLQFIKPEKRQALVDRIYQGLLPGGVLILSEKIRFDDSEQQWMDELHLDFKRANGYSELEISQKRAALENVMITDTDEQHQRRLSQAGFSQTSQWYRCFNFCSYLAIK
jgi:tRNA (cmo5U34)-methyltransferase